MAEKPEGLPEAEVESTESPEIEVATPTGMRPSTDANVAIQIIVGVIGTLLVAFGVMPLKGGRFDYFWAIINNRGVIQYIELFMAFMVATLIVLKIRIVRNQLRVIATAPVDTNIDFNDDVQIQDLRKQIASHPMFLQSIALSRMDRILAMWLEQKDVARISNWASAESSRDTSASDSSYALARVLIWAIPILGFIGTVQGLGSAVSGFSQFLAGAAELTQIKDAIARVTIGLGVAFDTTFLALILVTFLMFPLSAVQRREETLFVEIDIYLDDNVISRFPSPESKPIVIENLEDSIEAAFRRYIPDPDRYDEVFTRSIERAAGTVEEKFATLVKHYEAALQELGTGLSASLTNVGDSLQQAMVKVAGDMREEGEALLNQRRLLVQEEVSALQATLAEVNAKAQEIAGQYRESAEAIEKATRESAEISAAAAGELAARLEDVGRLAGEIQELLSIQEAVQKSITGIASAAEFQSTLQDLRRHLAATDALCTRLSKPRVITLREEPA
jgi:hypothetical protein